ncbi:hypothetical protein [Caldicoprobacter faecalis]|uniref:Uncharacterized protein n=1 Tax=Caldicoprobacter faecalis TaxID=937334 RepID=A0A1I5UQ71_9FIRM|nr:hypothetical protein [Caldicoprobacter faecalis]SFP97379.1 hypothetical protein SAMN05444406_10818 [Caldicoprobacter faecalis]
MNGLDKYLANFNINNIVKIDEESGIITIKGTANKSTKAFPNAVIDLINPKLNKIIQRRFYDEKGNAKIDIDLTDHNKPWAHDVPHVHEWIDGKRSKKWRKPTEQEKEFIKDIWDGDDV